MPLKGYSAPLSPDGRAGIVPPPPWHYSGDFLVVEYRANPDAVIALLPPELQPSDDPGAMAAVFVDWQSCSGDFHELVDPIQSQYRECFFTISCKFQGQPGSRCVYIWVDKDFAMYRGWIQGFPKKLGSIHLTRTFAVGKAAPKVGPGARFGATCCANDRQICRAVVTLREISQEGSKVTSPPMYNTRHFPACDGLIPDVFEMVRSGGFDREATEIWEGDAELKIFDDTIEDLQAIAPREVLKGYRFSFAYTVDGGKVLAQHNKELTKP
jgi:acetoacetate decarboxylase